ncbi:NUDIX hydrolase [Candidatus Daviesbacteria bacterium]|nr:NUDIX hydrolase [Candidatus Daviesbacteria bacterium]
MKMKTNFSCVIHGSFRKHFDVIQKIYKLFIDAGIEVLAPQQSEIVSIKDGFALFEGEEKLDQRLIELIYLHNLKKLGENGFSYFINPEGYIGKSTSYELGIAQLTNTRCFYYSKLEDHPAYVHKNAVWTPEDLVTYILENGALPTPQIKRSERLIHKMWEDLMVPCSVVATGAIIEYQPKRRQSEKEILLVKTHKWGNKYSIVGGKVKRNERLEQALIREVKEETGLQSEIGQHICTFDQIKNSGYYLSGIQHIFVDNIVKVTSKKVFLNGEAQDYIWIPAKEALEALAIEPNARHTVQMYATRQSQLNIL